MSHCGNNGRKISKEMRCELDRSMGGYKTRKYGPASHLTPEEAVKVAMETKSNVAVAMHWGTIELSDEPPWEPPVRFKNA